MPQILGPGMGCSLLTGKVFDSPFESNFVAPIIESSGATTELSLELVTNSRELYSKLRLAPDITILGGAFISTLEAKLANCVNTAAN